MTKGEHTVRASPVFEVDVSEIPQGNQILNSVLRVDPEGYIHNPRWQSVEEGRTRLTWQRIKLGLAPAIRQIEHVLARYGIEEPLLAEMQEAAHRIWMIFLTDPRKLKSEEELQKTMNELLGLGGALLAVKDPDKQASRDQFLAVTLRRGKDSRGRWNPQAMAARLITAITGFSSRLDTTARIKAHMVFRLSVLTDAHARIIATWRHLEQETTALLNHPSGPSQLKRIHAAIEYIAATDVEIQPYKAALTLLQRHFERVRSALNWANRSRGIKDAKAALERAQSVFDKVNQMQREAQKLEKAQEIIEATDGELTEEVERKFINLVISASRSLRHIGEEPFASICRDSLLAVTSATSSYVAPGNNRLHRSNRFSWQPHGSSGDHTNGREKMTAQMEMSDAEVTIKEWSKHAEIEGAPFERAIRTAVHEMTRALQNCDHEPQVQRFIMRAVEVLQTTVKLIIAAAQGTDQEAEMALVATALGVVQAQLVLAINQRQIGRVEEATGRIRHIHGLLEPLIKPRANSSPP